MYSTHKSKHIAWAPNAGRKVDIKYAAAARLTLVFKQKINTVWFTTMCCGGKKFAELLVQTTEYLHRDSTGDSVSCRVETKKKKSAPFNLFRLSSSQRANFSPHSCSMAGLAPWETVWRKWRHAQLGLAIKYLTKVRRRLKDIEPQVLKIIHGCF